MAQLDSKDCALDPVHSGVPTYHRMVVLPALAVIAEHANLLVELVIVRHDRTGFADRAEVFAWIEAEARCIAN